MQSCKCLIYKALLCGMLFALIEAGKCRLIRFE